MNIEITGESEKFVQDALASGRYHSVDELIASMARQLSSKNRELQAIETGLTSADAERVKTIDQFEHDFRQRHDI